MRSYCIETNIRSVYGIMTNFKEWIFTRYNLVSEAAKIIDIQSSRDNRMIKPHINPYEMSKVIKLIDSNNRINMDQLYKLIKIIQFLYSI
jgi:predicted XRE-type DNA-binding protein